MRALSARAFKALADRALIYGRRVTTGRDIYNAVLAIRPKMKKIRFELLK